MIPTVEGYEVVAKLFSVLLLAGSLLFSVLGSVLAFTIRSLDLQILDLYFVVLPRYLFLLSAALLLAAFVIWKTVVLH
jgi:hypothetical protein